MLRLECAAEFHRHRNGKRRLFGKLGSKRKNADRRIGSGLYKDIKLGSELF